MRKGIDIKTIRNKKTYQAPVLEEVTLDRDIILMGYSGVIISDPPGTTSVYSTNKSELDNSSSQKGGMFPNTENPFGGVTPDYER